MSMQVTVEVTQEDIDKGKRRCCIACPIAMAINRVIPGTHAAVCDLNITVYLPNGDRLTADPPDDASWFIEDFDDGLAVKPFRFQLTLA